MANEGRKTKDLAELFNVAEPTIRAWCGEFEDYLSPDANPGEGRTRYYNDDDVKVLALVAEMKTQGKTFEDIHASLKTGVRGDVESAVQAAQQRPQSVEQALVYIQQLVNRVNSLEDQITTQTSEIAEWRDKANRLEGQLEAMRETGTHTRIIELERTIAVLEYQLNQAKKGGEM